VARVLALTGCDKAFPVFSEVGPAAFSAGLAAFSGRLAGRPAEGVKGMVTAAAAGHR
jgi:hypothetical protein